ncbi:hypothetical protein QBC38DRAFT_547850 [Podospora fimiseda]|uniref:NACHT domain-containing protein n=1 Tax=Podospora fimiseda TaxID=252190 RepID=A0AAN7BJ71_9PEZI|nr:hypothetical protein QBC38DRAFT_547850 [Podospora fimiseda]
MDSTIESVELVIGFACDTIGLCKSIYRGELPDPTLIEYDLAAKCSVAARALVVEAKFLVSQHAKGDLLATFKLVNKTKWRQRRLERLEKSLEDYAKIMRTQLLVRICTQSHAAELRQRNDFDKLDKFLQALIIQWARGKLDTAKLNRSETFSLKRHTSVSQKVENSVNTHTTLEVNRVQDNIASQILKDRLLHSLKYPGMNARKNQIAVSHALTFGWILDSNDKKNLEHHYVRSDNFLEWLKSENGLYWISGKPGSGKSTLVKFLVDHPGTRSALQEWRPNLFIMSHFLWKLGSEMQSSAKGLLCSLIHQVLCRDETNLWSTLSTFSFVSNKEEYTDWSFEELTCISKALLSVSSLPVCIFIDGLDEVSDKESADLMLETVRQLRIDNAKLYVSSRPEPVFVRRFLLMNEQHMRLQDLTAADMFRYAHAKIKRLFPGPEKRSSKDLTHRVEMLVTKADGVFLWLHLAIQSLTRGVENGDSEEELDLRVQSLPPELSALYYDMSTRLNEERGLYRLDTARFLNLMLDTRVIRNRLDNGTVLQIVRPHKTEKSTATMSLLQLSLATNADVQATYIDRQASCSTAQIHQLCMSTRNKILIRCAGLVDVADIESIEAEGDEKLRNYDRVFPEFIHRTALDFLTDSEDGQKILSHDPCSLYQRLILLIRGELARAKLGLGDCPQDHNSVRTSLSLLSVDTNISRAEQDEILHLCWKFHDLGYLQVIPMSGYRTVSPRPHFLAVVAGAECDNFDYFIVEKIRKESDPSVLATRVLQDLDEYKLNKPHQPLHFRDRSTVMGRLLDLKGNVEARASSFRPDKALRLNDFDRTKVSCAVPFTSPLEVMLRAALEPLQKPSPQWIKFIRDVVSRGCNLSRRIPLGAQINNFLHRDSYMRAMSVTGSGAGIVTRISNPLRLGQHKSSPVLVLEANAAFLIDMIRGKLSYVMQYDSHQLSD